MSLVTDFFSGLVFRDGHSKIIFQALKTTCWNPVIHLKVGASLRKFRKPFNVVSEGLSLCYHTVVGGLLLFETQMGGFPLDIYYKPLEPNLSFY